MILCSLSRSWDEVSYIAAFAAAVNHRVAVCANNNELLKASWRRYRSLPDGLQVMHVCVSLPYLTIHLMEIESTTRNFAAEPTTLSSKHRRNLRLS